MSRSGRRGADGPPEDAGGGRDRTPDDGTRSGDHGARNEGERLTIVADRRLGERGLEAAAERAFRQVRVRWVSDREEARALARAEAPGTDLLAVAGGDDIVAGVLAGVFADGVPVAPRVVLCSLTRSSRLGDRLAVPRTLQGALWVAATGTTIRVDTARVRGEAEDRIFLDALVAGAPPEERRLRGALARLVGTQPVRVPARVRVRWDGGDEVDVVGVRVELRAWGRGARGSDAAPGGLAVTLGAEPARSVVRSLLRRQRSGNPAGDVYASTLILESTAPATADGVAVSGERWSVETLSRSLQVRGGWMRPPGAPI